MKNSTAKIGGFLIGAIGFLLLFKVLVLNRTSPDDELAPGVVVFAAILSGLALGYAGGQLQKKLQGN